MSAPRVRPRFELEIGCDPDRLMEGLRDHLPNCPNCTGVSVGRHAELFVPEADQRLWSPWLSVTADEADEGAVLRGRFAPHPNGGELIPSLQFGLGFALLVGTTWDHSRVKRICSYLKKNFNGVLSVLGVALYVASQIGQRLGAEQMTQLRAPLEELI